MYVLLVYANECMSMRAIELLWLKVIESNSCIFGILTTS